MTRAIGAEYAHLHTPQIDVDESIDADKLAA